MRIIAVPDIWYTIRLKKYGYKPQPQPVPHPRLETHFLFGLYESLIPTPPPVSINTVLYK